MASSNPIEACKKRKSNPKMLFNFEKTDVAESIKSLNYVPFREIIRLFLQNFTEVKEQTVDGMKIWSSLVINEPNGVVFPLYIIEETVQFSLKPFCDHCKFSGWGHNYVSKRRYHLIILEKNLWDKPLKCGFSELQTHILYGLIHCNGYGHLLCINGFKLDSNFISESDLMDFWDRICSSLNTRKISVCDSLKEGLMELRLLHGVAFGQSFFSKWGFKFSRGSYGVTEQTYEAAIEYLSSFGLDRIIKDFNNKVAGRHINKIIYKYRELSETPLITLGDLLQFMLGFKLRGSTHSKRREPVIQSVPHQDLKAFRNKMPMKFDKLVTSISKSCRWPAIRIESTLMVVVNLLQEKKANGDGERGITRHELREETRKYVGDTGLIDFVLKSIECFAMGNHIIRRSINSSTRKYEFKIHEMVKEAQPTGFSLSALNSDCRWPGKTVKDAAEVVISLLKADCGKQPMPMQELQEKAGEAISDSGLIDFVLESMSNSMIGNQLISCSKHPSTKRVEFSIEDVINQGMFENISGLSSLDITYDRNVYEDVLFLYSNVLFGYKESDSVCSASRIIIDSQNFMKEWLLEDQEMDQLMALNCQVLPSFEELQKELTRPLSPGEVVVVPPSITIGELKGFAQSAFRDTYCIMDKFVVNQVGGLRGIEDDKVLSCTMKPNAHVWIRGSGLDLDTELRYEGGPHKLDVDCICGARDDDGEMMMLCDGCQVRQHARCNGIDDDDEDEAAPSMFLCASCSRD